MVEFAHLAGVEIQKGHDRETPPTDLDGRGRDKELRGLDAVRSIAIKAVCTNRLALLLLTGDEADRGATSPAIARGAAAVRSLSHVDAAEQLAVALAQAQSASLPKYSVHQRLIMTACALGFRTDTGMGMASIVCWSNGAPRNKASRPWISPKSSRPIFAK